MESIKKRFFKSTRNLSDDEIRNEIQSLEQVDYTPLYSKDIAYHNYGYIHTFRVISDGLRQNWLKQLMGGLLAGIWIGFAYTAVVYSTYAISNPSVAKLLTGLLFAGVILMISFLGGGFVTAHMWYNRTMFKKVERWSIFLKACAWVYLGNILGIGIFVSILYLANGFAGGAPDNNIITKVYDGFGLHKLYNVGHKLGAGEAITGSDVWKTITLVFASAILCNFLICLATQGAKSTKGNTVASMIMYLLILMFFAIGGYQHSVANWYGAWSLILMAIDGNIVLNTNLDGSAQLVFNANAAWLFILLNILPAIVGNFVGALIIGLFMGWFNIDYDTLLLKEARLKFLTEILYLREHPNANQRKARFKSNKKRTSK
ncbi:formate/nitrite transporter family protein [Mesoplasma seiffertii]|uniref:formate/nitrite transporter family protein n=1 Tax=Mesoplasma seiffertii TaxID=28224 RepID=UPI0004793E39|nr:formate/nitrite transporter family protein [Mesoplasma seiffertii]